MNTIKSIISTVSLYIMFGVWSFIHMMEYKYFTRIEQYDSIVDNMDNCNKKYTELLLKMIHMENRIAELEDILYITDELSLEQEVAPKVVEESVPVDNFDAGELVDLSTEEKETNSNKKGWVKTLLFL